MKQNSMLYTILISLVAMIVIYFIIANVFNMTIVGTRYGGATDVSFLKL